METSSWLFMKKPAISQNTVMMNVNNCCAFRAVLGGKKGENKNCSKIC